VHDGPGIRTTVFLKGCPLHCLWCHSPESQRPEPELMYFDNLCLRCSDCVTVCPTQAQTTDTTQKIVRDRCTRCGRCVATCYSGALKMVGRYLGVDEVLHELHKDVQYYRLSQGGITVSGGEPTLQPQFTQALLKACKDQGYHTALETCGYATWSIFQSILPYVDLVLYDCKHINREKHIQFTGVPNDLIIHNLRKLDRVGSSYVVRVPVIPTINDAPNDIEVLATLCRSLKHLQYIELLPYHRLGASKYQHLARFYSLSDLHPPQDNMINQISEALQSRGLTVVAEKLPE
jgi:pyruvate formate lyase activating enzyme